MNYLRLVAAAVCLGGAATVAATGTLAGWLSWRRRTPYRAAPGALAVLATVTFGLLAAGSLALGYPVRAAVFAAAAAIAGVAATRKRTAHDRLWQRITGRRRGEWPT